MDRVIFSDKYRLMIYFVHATIDIYRETIPRRDYKTVESFVRENLEVVDRVNQEAFNVFAYELSGLQLAKGIASWLSTPQNVFETEAYKLPLNTMINE